MVIGCTKKLQDFLQKEILPACPESDSFYSWSASLLSAGHRKMLVCVHDDSRCGFVIYGIKKQNLKKLDVLISEGIRSMLESQSFAPNVIESYLNVCMGEILLTKTKNRSAVSRLNRFCQRVECFFEDFNPDDPFQKHLLFMFNDELVTQAGAYKFSSALLAESFQKHFSAVSLIACPMATLRIKLRDPACYRRVVIPLRSTLNTLHWVIQILFGWKNAHIHEYYLDEEQPLDTAFPQYDFLITEDELGNPCMENMERYITLKEVFEAGKMILYTYNLGACWEHEITMEKVEICPAILKPACLMASGLAPKEEIIPLDFADWSEGLQIALYTPAEKNEPVLNLEEINRQLQYIRC